MALHRHRPLVRLVIGSVLTLACITAYLVIRGGGEEYVAGEHTEGLVDTLARDLPDDCPPIRFVDVAAEAGLDFVHFPAKRSGTIVEDMGSGVALGDIDGDGWTDALLINASPMDGGAPGTGALLFRNRGDGGFEDITQRAGLELGGQGMAAAFFDRDGDGDLDLLTTAYGPCRLFNNDGSGRFEEISAAAGVSGFEGFWSGISVGDYDRDGDVDAYVCGYIRYDGRLGGRKGGSQYSLDIPVLLNPSSFEPERNLLFRNRGDGTFEEVAEELGVDNPAGRSLGAVFCDIDGNGWPDLYIANDVSDNALFLGTGDGAFLDRTTEATLGDYRGAMGLAVGDPDRDLDLDLYVTHWVGQENALYLQFPRDPEDAVGRAPRFLDFGDAMGLGSTALRMVGWATRFFDYDNDGWPDLFVVNGSTIPDRGDTTRLNAMRSHLYWNGGEGRGFFEVGGGSGEFFSTKHVGRGGATFDYDLDGDEDLLFILHGEPAVLLRNDGGNARSSVRLRLRMPSGNTHALGSVVRLTAGETTMLETIGSQGSYLSQHAVGEVAFGLGEAGSIDRIEVTWPDGTVETAGPFPVDSWITWERDSEPEVSLLPGKVAFGLQKPEDVDVLRHFYKTREKATDARLAGTLEEAVLHYSDALSLWPGHDDCLYYLAQTLIELGQETRALSVFRRTVEYHPRSSRAWMQIGFLRLPGGEPQHDDIEAAAEAFSICHEINGEESRPVVQMGIVALLRGELDEASRLLADATVLNPRSVEGFYFGGRAAWLRGNRERAEELLQRAHAALSGATARDDSVSSEGQTETGRAMLAAETASASILHRWRSLAERAVDVDLEYGP